MSIAVFNKFSARIDALRFDLDTANARILAQEARIAELERAATQPQGKSPTLTLPQRATETRARA